MEQIKLEHLAPYLPHELKCYTHYYKANLTMDVGGVQGFTICISDVIAGYAVPVLMPLWYLLDDLQIRLLEVELHKEMSYAIREWVAYFESDTANIDNAILCAPYPVINWAMSKHFDIFNLIPRGLAIEKKI